MKIGEPRYGEPWDLWTSCSWRRAFDSVGKAALMPTVLSDGQPDIYPADNVARSVLCVNELAGYDFEPGEVRRKLEENEVLEESLDEAERDLVQARERNEMLLRDATLATVFLRQLHEGKCEHKGPCSICNYLREAP